MNQKSPDSENVRKGIGLKNTVLSTIAAAIGVQSRANRERDFEHAKPSTFIIAGIVFVIVFILAMYGIVQLVISLAAPS